MMRQIPGPGTHPHDWMPDYQQRAHPCRDYLPRSLTPGRAHVPTGRPPGRPRGGRHNAKRRAQWARSKARARNKNKVRQTNSKQA